MPTVITQGAASAKGYGFGARATTANYIEDVFSTYLYTGTGASQTITNGIDLSTKGGMVWLKDRTTANPAWIMDTTRGTSSTLQPSSTGAAGSISTAITAFGTTGFTIGTNSNSNTNNNNYVSWTFRKQAKFFDVVTYTGNGINGTAISHNLGSVPGCIIIKRTDTTGDWYVYHRSYNGGVNPEQYTTYLNLTNAVAGPGSYSQYQAPTSTAFYPGGAVNAAGGSAKYVAYLFAHNAGGFGASGSDNVISCGSFTTNSNGDLSLNLGWEPQWLVLKTTSAVGPWYQYDIMRGLPVTASSSSRLSLNTSAAEVAGAESIYPTPTGLTATGQLNPNTTYIYIAIRRGPMKTPTSGTSVFGLNARTGTGANATVTGGQTDDAVLIKNRGSAVGDLFAARLTGTAYLETSSTAAEVAAGTTILQANPWDVMDGVKVGTTSTITNASSNTFINYLFRRAPGFFDVVCYTGNSTAGRTVNHNLGVTPEMIIVKNRTSAFFWRVQQKDLGPTKVINLNLDSAASVDSGSWNNTSPTASVFTVGTGFNINASGENYVAYLFATCPGVSKVGSYTGTGTTKQIDCGFTGGARFVLIKRTDSTGDWYVWDTARGIVSGNDPYLLLNSTAAEVTNTDYIDTYSAGFEISSTAPAAINANGGSFIFLAIA